MRGLHGRPTLIESAETLAKVSAVLQLGPGQGRPGERTDPAVAGNVGAESALGIGTKIVTVSGDVPREATVEVALGSTLRAVVESTQGTTVSELDLKAVQVGGPAGCFFAGEGLDTPLDFEGLAEAGGDMGSGSIYVYGAGRCAVETVRDLVALLHEESCGKCVFCREGTRQLLGIMDDLVNGVASEEQMALLVELAEAMKGGSICALGLQASTPVLSSLRLFADDYRSHLENKKCPKELRMIEQNAVSLIIDGQSVVARAGASVLEAALEAGIYVPHLCHHPDLPAGRSLPSVRGRDRRRGGSRGLVCHTGAAKAWWYAPSRRRSPGCVAWPWSCCWSATRPSAAPARSTSTASCSRSSSTWGSRSCGSRGVRSCCPSTAATRSSSTNPTSACSADAACGPAASCAKWACFNTASRDGEHYIYTLDDRPLAESGCRFCGACAEVCPTGAIQDKEELLRRQEPQGGSRPLQERSARRR